jgi:VCBS repeat protein
MGKCRKPKGAAVVLPPGDLDPRTPATTYPFKTNSWSREPLQAAIVLGFVALAALLAAAPEGRAQTPSPTAPSATTPPPSAKTLHDWRRGMRQAPLPKKGCFTSSYPSTEWQEVPCTTAPARPYPPALGPRPDTVGGGNDVSAQVTGHISEAIGSFDSVTGVTSVTDPNAPSGFSLQLNSNRFTTPACNGSLNPTTCRGWQQFVYSNSGVAFIQYWLIGYNTTCPANWMTFAHTPPATGNDCWQNGVNAVSVPVQAVANLVNLNLTGQANVGGVDTLIMATGSNLYSEQEDDGILSLAPGWQAVEFAIVGDCCGSQANFNSGSTIVVRTSVDYGSQNAPSCAGPSFTGFTAETNNLFFVQASAVPSSESLPALVFTQSSTSSTTLPCNSATGAPASSRLADTHDFSGDGKSDIGWRDAGGDAAVWLMNGAAVLQSALVGSAPAVWSIVGQRDFNGDGKADWLWRDTGGNVAMWFLDGVQIMQSVGVGNVSTAWSIVGTGDFNGDGKGDILWADGSGNVAVWLMNGGQVLQSAGVGAVSTTWSIVGTGDFNGDGKTDILWHDTSGNVAIWFMNGTQVSQSAGVGNATTAWSIAGTGDFNGDGKSDVLWRDTSGNLAMWLMNGAQVSQSLGVGFVPTSWSIIETGDFNDDGKSDILWQDVSANVAIWFMDGAQVTPAGVGAAPGWSIQGVNAD